MVFGDTILNAIAQNLHFLGQGQTLLADIDPSLFRATDTDGQGGRIGAHFRHVIDFYRCFLDGIQSGRVNYDARQREPELEVEPGRAIEAMRQIAIDLERLTPADLGRILEAKADAADAANPTSWSASSVGRELIFLTSHTVHHFALIALLLRHNGYQPDASFGVAPSTLVHRAEVAAGVATEAAAELTAEITAASR